MPRKWPPRPEDRESDESSLPSSAKPTDTSSRSARTLLTPSRLPSVPAGGATSSSVKPKSTLRSRSRAGGLVPLERAAGSSRLPALDPARARQSDIAKKFRAVVGGKMRPRPAPENAFSTGPSKYSDDDED